MNTAQAPTLTSVLSALKGERLYDLGRTLGASLPESSAMKANLVARLARALNAGRLSEILRELGRDELRVICRSHQLDERLPRREDLNKAILTAGGYDPSASIPPPSVQHDGVPSAGQVLSARGRQWLVEASIAGEGPRQSPFLRLACLDDDSSGRKLELLWDLEIGAKVIEPRVSPLGKLASLDPPSHFGAYLHTLKWSSVSAADATRFQAPFRAGIKLMTHQLTPLMKALELPRANLFIADDVGLSKTIEAGLVLQELILRQQAKKSAGKSGAKKAPAKQAAKAKSTKREKNSEPSGQGGLF